MASSVLVGAGVNMDAQTDKPSLLQRARQFFCGLTGHDETWKWSRNEVWLECASCGHCSPGWNVTRKPLQFR